MMEEILGLIVCLIFLWLLFNGEAQPRPRHYKAPPCKNCGGNHPSYPPPLSMGSYARTYASTWGWEPCWGPIPPEYKAEKMLEHG